MAKKRNFLLLPFAGGRSRAQDPHRGLARPVEPESDDDEFLARELTRHETAAEFATKKEEDIVQDYNAPIHWWVISTLFPLIAGTFGPMASAFNILAVCVDWRIVVDTSSSQADGQHITDPRWLVAVNAVSLAVAVVANLALLGQMTQRIPFTVAAPTVIGGWFFSGIVDIALVSAASQRLPLPKTPQATYSQAFYYAAFAGAIYVILAFMLTWTAWGVFFGHLSSEFKLSLSQRSLMLQTMLFLAYVLLAGVVFSTIEGWNYEDGVYYVIVTVFTIGFGDLVPTSHLARSLYFPMSVGGIIFVGLIIADVRTLVLESASVKVSTRLVEKARYNALKDGNLKEGIFKIWGKLHHTSAPTELERRKNEFNVMREIQKVAARHNRMVTLTLAIGAFFILWMIGAVAFWYAEKGVNGQDWSYFEALYFTFTAQLTIGYGDFEPQTNSAKPVFVFWALLALPTLTVLIGAVGDAVTDFVQWGTVGIGQHFSEVLNMVTGLKSAANKTETLKRDLSRIESNDGAGAKKGFADIAAVEHGRLVPHHLTQSLDQDTDRGLADDAYRPLIVVQAAQRVLSHMEDDSDPRQYDHDEWAWLLRLLGDDESAEHGHRRIGHVLEPHHEVICPVREHPHQLWSWVGQESPLMTLQGGTEPVWVLKRLMHVLERDFRRRGDRQMANRSSAVAMADDGLTEKDLAVKPLEPANKEVADT